MFEHYRLRRSLISAQIKLNQNKGEMIKSLEQDLSEKIEKVYRADFDGNLRAETIERLKPARDFLHYLKQEKLRERLLYAGITIPDEYMRAYNDEFLLNKKGEQWAHIQLRKYREQRIEFWAKLIIPVLSLIMSIVALIVSTHIHK